MQYKILIVDDIKTNLKLMHKRLTDAGYQVEIAENGQQALDRLSESRPDLILMDLRMPVMDGYQTTEKIRADESVSNIPVIAFSAAITDNDRDDLTGRGFDDICMKPIKVNDLLPRVEGWLLPSEEDLL